MDRRTFLRMMALSSSSMMIPSLLRADSSFPVRKSPNNRITIGSIGVGGQGTGDMGQALALPDAQVVAVCDVNADHAKNAAAKVESSYAKEKTSGTFKGCDIYSDFRELLARPDIDAVIIATPDHWHALTTIAAVMAGKDVYVEKPAATSIPESRAMVEAVRRSGAVCQVGSMQRAMTTFQRAVELARNGFLGEITQVTAGIPQKNGIRGNLVPPLAPQQIPEGFNYDFWLGPAPQVPYYKERCDWNWRWSFDYGGGQVTDWIGHHYDIAAWTLGLSNESPVAVRNVSGDFPVDDPLFNTANNCQFEAHFANGKVIKSGPTAGVRFEGTEGWVEASRKGVNYGNSVLERAIIPADGFNCKKVGHMEAFLQAVRDRTTPTCPIWEAHHVASTGHLVNAAMRSGLREVNFDTSTEQIVGAPEADSLLHRAYRGPWVLPA